MKYYSWDQRKNEILRRNRGISFDEVIFHIERGDLLDVVEHPNRKKYRNQRIFIINIDHYAYLVPFEETENEIFLRTIIPSRKATRKYFSEERENEKAE